MATRSKLEPPARNFLLDVVMGRRRGAAAGAARVALASLSYAYSAGLKLFFVPYRLGIRRRARLARPVVSIGNLTVGGTGKTSVTQTLAERLRAEGLRVCILSRGYRGANEYGAAVVSTERRVELDQRAAGDEAYLLARTLPGVPVLVGKDRRVTGALAADRFDPDVILLDDGLQYYWLHRDLDIVLLDALHPFDNGWTFPRGLMREPPSHLCRAGAVMLTNVDKAAPQAVQDLRRRVEQLAPGRPVYTARYAPVRLVALDGSCELPTAWLAGRPVATLCGLANPAAFEEQVAQADATVAHSVRLPDHHEPTINELNQAIDAACRAGAEAVIVSEKDAVKLPPVMRPLPFYALVARQEIDDFGALLAQVIDAVRRGGRANRAGVSTC